MASILWKKDEEIPFGSSCIFTHITVNCGEVLMPHGSDASLLEVDELTSGAHLEFLLSIQKETTGRCISGAQLLFLEVAARLATDHRNPS